MEKKKTKLTHCGAVICQMPHQARALLGFKNKNKFSLIPVPMQQLLMSVHVPGIAYEHTSVPRHHHLREKVKTISKLQGTEAGLRSHSKQLRGQDVNPSQSTGQEITMSWALRSVSAKFQLILTRSL